MSMRQKWLILTALVAAGALAGCEHPSARISALQDPKYPVGRDSKIALPDYQSPQAADLANRLAGETVAEQMRAMGFHLVTPTEAEFQLSFSIADKDESQSYTVNVPTMSTVVGTTVDGPVTGTVFGDQAVPQTRIVNMTRLDLWLIKTQEPKVEIWHGHIEAEASDAQRFRTPFFRALLEHVGETVRGVVQLDADKTPSK